MKNWFLQSLKIGFKMPLVWDEAEKKASFRLSAAYFSFLLACLSLVALHFFDSLLAASWTTIAFYAIATTFYMLKKLNKAKIDLDDKSLEFDASDTEENNKA